MSRPQRYPWPTQIGAHADLDAPDRTAATAAQTAASKYAQRKGWMFRTRWLAPILRVRRAA